MMMLMTIMVFMFITMVAVIMMILHVCLRDLYYPGRSVVRFYYFKVAKAWRVPRFRGK